MTKQKPFSREIVRKMLALREVYADEGYAYAEVVPVSKEDDRSYTVDITYQAPRAAKCASSGSTSPEYHNEDNVIRRNSRS